MERHAHEASPPLSSAPPNRTQVLTFPSSLVLTAANGGADPVDFPANEVDDDREFRGGGGGGWKEREVTFPL